MVIFFFNIYIFTHRYKYKQIMIKSTCVFKLKKKRNYFCWLMTYIIARKVNLKYKERDLIIKKKKMEINI